MEVKLQLCIFLALLNLSLAVLHITVMKGQTLNLRCPLTVSSQNHPVEWKNPDGNIMFYNMIQVQRDKRYSLHKLSEFEFNIKVSNVTFSDGGRYTCSHYLRHTKEKTVEVTVLDKPQIQVTTYEGRIVIKCTAESNHPPPQIFWMLRNGPEFHNHPQILHEDKKFVSIEMLNMKPTDKVIAVKCIVRHPALHSRILMDFVKIKPSKPKSRRRTTTPPSLPWTTLAPETTRELTTRHLTTTLTEDETVNTELPTATSQVSTSNTDNTTEFPSATSQVSTSDGYNENVTTQFPSDISQPNSSDGSTVLPNLPTTQNQTSRISNSTSGWTSVAITTFNGTRENSTENGYDVERREGREGNTSLFVFLVTCLIIGLLVVVIFIGIKLRRAHVAWKRENDDSDTSEASSKSKSSQEEKNAQRRRGFFNTGLTQYVVQEPTVITSVTNPAAMTSTEDTAKEQKPSPTQLPAQNRPTAKSNIKETEL